MKSAPAPRITLDDIRAQHLTGRNRCSLHRLMNEQMSEAERRVILDAIRDVSTIQSSAIVRALAKIGLKIDGQVIARHRRTGCLDCGVVPNLNGQR